MKKVFPVASERRVAGLLALVFQKKMIYLPGRKKAGKGGIPG